MNTATTPARGPDIQLRQISLKLDQTTILDQLDWQLAGGEVHALVGPNGCGKSSLLKTILGLMPHRGTVQLHWPGQRAGVVGYVPQMFECDRTLPMTVRDFLATMHQKRPLFWGLERTVASQIEQALEQVNMAHKATQRMGALSGGERQRVLIAQSLLPPPDLLLLDEPMAALDKNGIAVYENLLQQWRRQGVTVLWVEHDLDAVYRLADRVSGLNGSILFCDQPHVLHDSARLLQLFARTPVATPRQAA